MTSRFQEAGHEGVDASRFHVKRSSDWRLEITRRTLSLLAPPDCLRTIVIAIDEDGRTVNTRRSERGRKAILPPSCITAGARLSSSPGREERTLRACHWLEDGPFGWRLSDQRETNVRLSGRLLPLARRTRGGIEPSRFLYSPPTIVLYVIILTTKLLRGETVDERSVREHYRERPSSISIRSAHRNKGIASIPLPHHLDLPRLGSCSMRTLQSQQHNPCRKFPCHVPGLSLLHLPWTNIVDAALLR